jgi:predicted O-methyltransferase YrrM
LEHIAKIHKLDVTKELGQFFQEYPHLQFKLVFMDAGSYEVVSSCLPHFWPRLLSGGVLIFDQFNHEIAPGETRAAREYLPDNVPINSFVFTTMPSAYAVKP